MSDRKNKSISKNQIKSILDEEILSYMKEQFPNGQIEEGFFQNMKNAGSGLADYYKILMQNYAKTLDDMVNNQMIPQAQAQRMQPEQPNPEEFAQSDNEEKVEDVMDISSKLDDLEKAAQASGDKEMAAKVADMNDAAEKVEDAAEEQLGGAEGGKGGGEPEVSAALLDIVDAVAEKWEKIRDTTKDKSLQKAMDYVEQIALAEQVAKRIANRILKEMKR